MRVTEIAQIEVQDMLFPSGALRDEVCLRAECCADNGSYHLYVLTRQGMKSIDDIRTDNLRLLSDEQGDVGKVALAIGREQSQISQWLNRSPMHGTGKPRVISTRSCRLVEKALGKSEGWMDRDQLASSEVLSAEVLFTGFRSMSVDEQLKFFHLLGEAYVARTA